MNYLVLDFETSFAADYTLRTMTTEAYVRDPRFQALLLGVVTDMGVKKWIGHEDIPDYLADIDWKNTCVIAHHAQFDGLILAHHYGVTPAQWVCTMSMARMALGPNQSVALAALSKRYGFPEKTVPYDLFKGRRWEHMDPVLRNALGEGCIHDCELTAQLYVELAKTFPKCEYPVVDMTVRMFTEPVLVGDQPLLQKLQQDEFFRKGERMVNLGVNAKQLQSAIQFVELLEAEGVEVAVKTTPAGNTAPAIAKSDYFMQDLLDHESERVRELVEARLDVKSTIDETRAGRLLHMAERGPMCIYLNYCGAQNTLRWSGGDKVNFQNLKRSGEIRKALMAPEGHDLVVGDCSQIECRLLNMLAGQNSVIDAFREKRDIYSELATTFYGRSITKENKAERGTGKQLELSCGYGSGASTIQVTARRGTYGPPVMLTMEEATRARDVYRMTHPAVVNLWREAEQVLHWLESGMVESYWRIFEIRDQKIYHPNGTWLDYSGLKWDQAERQFTRTTRRGTSKMYGAKLVENVIQWIARLVMSEAMVRLVARGLRPVNTTHDELMLVVPKPYGPQTLEILLSELRQAPAWMPDIPLDAEGFHADRYEK